MSEQSGTQESRKGTEGVAIYSPDDMDLAAENFGAMCGHGALAAALGVPVLRVMQYFEKGGWLNIPMMQQAIGKAGWSFRKLGVIPPVGRGVVMMQFLGRWMEPGVPIGARCSHRHWAAFHGGLIWDANIEDWLERDIWEAWLPALYTPKTTGHVIERVLYFTHCNA